MIRCEICGEVIPGGKYIAIGKDHEGVHPICLELYLARLPIPDASQFDMGELLFQDLEDAYTEEVPDEEVVE